MPPIEILGQTPAWTWAAILAALAFAALAHGAIGFGFPLISTPLVALLTDVRTAVLATLLPNLVLNVISVVRGAQWRQTLRRYWPVALYVLLGTLVGTRVLAVADTDFLKLLLAALIVVFLVQARMGVIDASRLRAFPRLAPAVFGGLGGFFSGTVNVAVPPLLMYFSSLEIAPLAMTQALNLSFLVGRSTQGVALAATGKLSAGIALISVPLSVLSVACLFAGFRLQRHIRPETFARLVQIILWAMAAMLAGQVALAYFRSILPR